MESYVLVKRKHLFWKGYMKRILSKESDWDHNVEADTGPVDYICGDEVYRC